MQYIAKSSFYVWQRLCVALLHLLAAGSYEVILCIDNSESAASRRWVYIAHLQRLWLYPVCPSLYLSTFSPLSLSSLSSLPPSLPPFLPPSLSPSLPPSLLDPIHSFEGFFSRSWGKMVWLKLSCPLVPVQMLWRVLSCYRGEV